LQNYLKMNLRPKFENYNLKELIIIAESHTDYTIKAKEIALEIIKEKKMIDCINEAKKYWTKHININIKSILRSKTLPKSHFLNEKEIKLIIIKCFKNWQEKQKLFGIDITKYWAIPF